MHFVCPSFNAVTVISRPFSPSPCFSQLVCLSVGPWVHLLVPLYFFVVFELFEGKKVRPTVRLNDTVTCRAVCMRLVAIGLVFSSNSLF